MHSIFKRSGNIFLVTQCNFPEIIVEFRSGQPFCPRKAPLFALLFKSRRHVQRRPEQQTFFSSLRSSCQAEPTRLAQLSLLPEKTL